MLIELKDGDTVIIYGNMDHLAAQSYYQNMTDALGRGLKEVKFFMASAPQDSIVVYRASNPPAPVEESDGWFTWDSAPRDGQEIDVWIEPRGRVPEVRYSETHRFYFFDEGEKGSLHDIDGKPTHWRYPPKGPKA